MTYECKLTGKRQITVPKIILNTLGVGVGDTIAFKVEGAHIEVVLVKEKMISALDLTAKYKHLVHKKASLEDMKQAISKGARESARRNK